MRKCIAKFALLSALALAPCIEANAYEVCVPTDFAKIHKDSTRIILGEVVKIELIQAARGDSLTAHGEYVATLKPVEVFRGLPGAEVRVRFLASRMNSVILVDAEVIMKMGERYVLFEKEPDALRYYSICEDRVKKADKDIMDYLRSHN